MNLQDLWVVPKRATRDTNIEHVYGVGLEDEDENGEDEDLDQAGEIAGSSTSNLQTQVALSPPMTQAESHNSSNPALQWVCRYDVDKAVLRAMERGKIHELNVDEFRAICRMHDLSVRRRKSELMERVKVHFQGLYRK